MRAVVYDGYGPPDVLRLEEVEWPNPREGEILVKIHATTVSRADVHTREASRSSGLAVSLVSRLVWGLRRPRQRILGREFAGEVEAEDVVEATDGFRPVSPHRGRRTWGSRSRRSAGAHRRSHRIRDRA